MDSNKIEVLNALCDCIIKMQAIKISRVALFVLAICTIAAALIRVNAPGSILKAHKITLFMGNPQVAATDMLLDTGSSLTILPCASCVKCFGLKESIKYDPTVSFTSSAIKCNSHERICDDRCKKNQQFCEYNIEYLGGTSNYGNIYKDNISFALGHETMFRAFFGCIDIESSPYRSDQIGAVLGLGPRPEENILYSWFSQHPESQYTFSTCLSTLEGFFQIGTNSNDTALQPLFVSRFDGSQGFYILSQHVSLRLGSVDLLGTTYKVLIDTGTSFIIVPQAIFMAIGRELLRICSKRNICQTLIDEQITVLLTTKLDNVRSRDQKGSALDTLFPSLRLEVSGRSQTIKPTTYMRKCNSAQLQQSGIECYTLSIQSAKNNNNVILGLVWMQNKKLTFQLKQQIIKAYNNYNCSYTPVLLQKTYLLESTQKILNFFLSVKTQYYIIAALIITLLGILIKVYYDQIKAAVDGFKTKTVKWFKAKFKKIPKKKRTKHIIDLNNQVISRGDEINESGISNPGLPRKYKRRGRKGAIRNT